MSNITEPAKSTKRLLVVEDEPLALKLIVGTLRDAGFDVATAINGADAIENFRSLPSDLLITDQRLPDIEGEDVLAAIRRLAPGIPAIVMTGLSTGIRRPELFSMVLQKPFRLGEIVEAVQSALEVG